MMFDQLQWNEIRPDLFLAESMEFNETFWCVSLTDDGYLIERYLCSRWSVRRDTASNWPITAHSRSAMNLCQQAESEPARERYREMQARVLDWLRGRKHGMEFPPGDPEHGLTANEIVYRYFQIDEKQRRQGHVPGDPSRLKQMLGV